MGYDDIVEKLIPRLAACRVDRVTLTGGESTIHPDFLDVVRAFRGGGMGVGVCTNATALGEGQILELAEIGSVHCNVSLDGLCTATSRWTGSGLGRTANSAVIETVSTPPSPPSKPSQRQAYCRACSALLTPWPRTSSISSFASSLSSMGPSTC
jgi:hypothetical protein